TAAAAVVAAAAVSVAAVATVTKPARCNQQPNQFRRSLTAPLFYFPAQSFRGSKLARDLSGAD
ncbi:MAG: hypothetical protein QG602_2370, partial [Verrucomicrobiota bacterium]|nr:hypothetical protein [Verrucomicrobiota bacterium]